MMIKKLLLFLCISLYAVCVWGIEPNPSIKYIQRSMKAMEESTAEKPARIRVLFYGQSIVRQTWTKQVQQYLQEKYPTVRFTFQNNAIGGYTSERLYRTAESDLYPWYPDILFFHVYGSMEKYEEIIRTTREKTTAEIVIWTSHLNAREDPNAMLHERDSRSKAILSLAEKYHCAVIDLNQKWCKLLLKNKWSSKELLHDSVHLTPKGCEYYAQYIQEELVRLPGMSGEESACGTIETISLNDSRVKKNANGSVSVKFFGNRICAINGSNTGKSAFATLLLDGKSPDTFKELWYNTRTSLCPKWMPSIFSVGFNTPLLQEDWTLTALPQSSKDGKKIYYRVEGSKTGLDGEGISTEDFVSKSGRVVIPKNSFNTMFDYFKMELPTDYKVTWKSQPLFAAPYRPAEPGDPVVLIQNCSNGEHVLTIKPTGNIGIESFIVHSPGVHLPDSSTSTRSR